MIPARDRRPGVRERYSQRTGLALAALLATSALAAGCLRGRVRHELPAMLPTPERLLAILAERRATVRTVRGFAQIAYQSGDENLGSRHAVLARRPDHFRLEVLSPFGALAVVACDGRDLVVYARRENKIYRGAASPESIAAYINVAVPVEDVVEILLGMPPKRDGKGRATVARDDAAGLVRLDLADGGGKVWFQPDTLYPAASESALPDGGTLRVDFDDFRSLGSFAFPFAIDMRAQSSDRAIRVRWTSPSLNTEIAEGLFAFPPRSGIDELMIEAYPAGDAPR